MKAVFFLIFTILVAFFFIHCERESSDTVAQDKIWAEYILKYEANEDVTYAQVVFRFSNPTGTNLELKFPAQVTFNGDLLSFKPAFAYYEKTYAGKVDSGTFIYIDLDKDTFINRIKVPSSVSFRSDFDSLPRNAAFELKWVGDSLLAYQSLTASIKGTYQNDLQVFYTNTLFAKSIILPKTQLGKLGPGAGKAYMTREESLSLQQGTSAGGQRIGRYKAVDKNIVIKQ